MIEAQVNDVIKFRHPFYMNRVWRVEKVLPSLDPKIQLYRVQLLKDNGENDPKVRPLSVPDTQLRENLGGYDQWLNQIMKTDSENSKPTLMMRAMTKLGFRQD